MRNIILKVDSITKIYGTKEVLKNISFNIEKGKITSLLGPNGSGKTTTLEIILMLRKPNKGKIYFNNEELSIKHITQIGALLQDAHLYKKIKVKEAFDFFGKFYQNPYSSEYLINFLKLNSDKKFFELSTGQKQKLMLGLAIIGNPDLLILDEPTSAMDPSTRREFWDFLRELKKQGKTIFLATHNLKEAEEISDNILLLKDGQIVLQGSIEDIKTKIFNQKIANLKLEKEKHELLLKFLEEKNFNYFYKNNGFIECNEVVFKEVMHFIEKNQLFDFVEVIEYKPISLENIFFHYVKN